jgi:hypothetical protein
MSHRIDPGPFDVEPALFDPMLDRPPAEAHVEKLPPSHAPVLLRRERRNHRVHGMSVTFCPYDGHDVTLVCHAPRMPGQR